MNTLTPQPLIATVLVATGMSMIPAHAEGLRVVATMNSVDQSCHSARGDSNPDPIEPAAEVSLTDTAGSAGAWSSFVRLGASHVIRDPSGWSLGGSALQVEAGPQYAVTDRLSIGGEWEHFQPFGIDGSPNIREYTFGLRASF